MNEQMVETPMKTMNTKVDRITQDKPGELEFLFFVLARVYRLNKINVKFLFRCRMFMRSWWSMHMWIFT